ncbi:hypothetical protein L1987_05167 [Smallanthus sonchifolius]|uniref:Uncharacterized protein n=1 Tax=Smallanthus sonchifolius TaxID=185202 RepID=A0ACB9JUT2_9ASTR|nr:hypothetical protein L1987_05167 [Smallanthus sonchifolius]
MHPSMAKITKEKERRGRKKIAELLSLMGFHDDDHDTTVEIMLRRLRQIEGKTQVATAHEKPSPIKKITIKFGGKTFVKVPLQTSVSEIIVVRDDDDMEIDYSSNDISSENHESNMINYDQSFEEIRLMNMETNLPSENPNSGGMEIEDFITSIGGSEAILVIEKKLTKSDCDKNQGRLLIPVLQVKNHGFLRMNEREKLGIREDVSVEVFDPERCKSTLNLAQWKMKNENYVLKTNWRKLVLKNGLKENMVIRVLAFRVDQQLCFAVVRV